MMPTLLQEIGTQAKVLLCILLLLSPLASATDSDKNGLDDSVETNTGAYISLSDTGTDPVDSDSDNVTIPDGLDLPAENGWLRN